MEAPDPCPKVQKGPSFKDGGGDVCYKSVDLYRIPEKFVEEIFHAITS